MVSDYYQRREARIERLRERAAKKGEAADAFWARAKSMASAIPFGQPILVGHHSEKRDRNYRAKIENGFRKGSEALDEAKELEYRAAAAAGNDAISSDAPDAVQRMEEKIAKMVAARDKMKRINKLIRMKDDAGLAALGLNPAQIEELKKPDFCGRIGFADFELTNLGANIRRCKERLEHLLRVSARSQAGEDKETHYINDVRVVQSASQNRLQIFFPGKPDACTREALKQCGFRWCPTAGAWQRLLNNSAIWNAESALERLGIKKIEPVL